MGTCNNFLTCGTKMAKCMKCYLNITVFGSGKMQTTRFCGERTGTCNNFLTRDTKMVKRVWMRTV